MSKGELTFKVVLLGDTFVGKTSLIDCYLNRGTGKAPQPTVVGSGSATKCLTYNDWKVTLSIWDTAGQERYRHLVPFCLHGAHCCLLVTDLTNKATFESMDYWIDFIRDNAPAECFIVLCANKVDDVERMEVSEEAFAERAEELHIAFCKTSAKFGNGVTQLFERIVSEVVKKEKPVQEKLPEAKDKSGCPC